MSNFTETLASIARAEIGVREHPRNSNRGERVDQYKAATWLNPKLAWAWCAAFVDWCVLQTMNRLGVKETKTFKRPRTAGAYDLINWSRAQDNTTSTLYNPKAKDIKKGDIIVFTFSHCGIADSVCDSNGDFITTEGNTDLSGSREGGGTYKKTRNISKVKARIRFTI